MTEAQIAKLSMSASFLTILTLASIRIAMGV